MGETVRPLSTRIKEHKEYVDKNTKLALGEHVVNNPGYKIRFEEVKVIDSESKTKHKMVVEDTLGPGSASSTDKGDTIYPGST